MQCPATLVRAHRAAYLIDGEAYFRALAEALARGRQSIYIAGWDIDARTRLPDPFHRGKRVSFRRFIDRLARRRPNLHVYLLGWDFAALFTLERLPFPALHLGWRTHERVHFFADGVHPQGASHHQKLVVVDDAVAFSGGFDVAVKRWDTPLHTPDDPRRVDPIGMCYPPFHDVQIALSGPAATVLAEVFRDRWRRATGEVLLPCERTPVEPWPPSARPDAHDAALSIVCTQPEWEGYSAICDVQRSYEEAILSARKWIYIENQYLSCEAIAQLLVRRLEEPDGPEVVVVSPRACSGWLEERTMGVLRGRLLLQVAAAKYAKERFRAVYPVVGDASVYIHSKVMVIDDAIARVGSANLTQRSMRIDSECDVSLYAGPDGSHAHAVATLRNRLLAEHLGTTEQAVERQLGAHGSIIRLVDQHGAGPRGVRLLADPIPSDEQIAWLRTIADPERPLDASRLVDFLGGYMKRKEMAGRLAMMCAAAAMTVTLVIVIAVVGQ
ncbi:MAG: hypothetical protein HOW73_12280 [Polyangiaceae bacterium]|nr:hypothetical protein [Polyangiaceae bacterium]